MAVDYNSAFHISVSNEIFQIVKVDHIRCDDKNMKTIYSAYHWDDWSLIVLYSWHNDVIKWKHFPRYWPFVWGIHRSPVNSPHKGQWRGTFMFSLTCVWINGWINTSESGDLRRYRAHYDVNVMGLQNVDKFVTSMSHGRHGTSITDNSTLCSIVSPDWHNENIKVTQYWPFFEDNPQMTDGLTWSQSVMRKAFPCIIAECHFRLTNPHYDDPHNRLIRTPKYKLCSLVIHHEHKQNIGRRNVLVFYHKIHHCDIRFALRQQRMRALGTITMQR